jgi:hypothetical protein
MKFSIAFDSTVMFDRTYPTLHQKAGFAEFIQGNALGCMRSERTDCLTDPAGSTFIFGPQSNYASMPPKRNQYVLTFQ